MYSIQAIDRMAACPRLADRRNYQLLSRAKAGDAWAQEKVVRHGAKLIRYAMSSLDFPSLLADDLYQEGLITISGAMDKYHKCRPASYLDSLTPYLHPDADPALFEPAAGKDTPQTIITYASATSVQKAPA